MNSIVCLVVVIFCSLFGSNLGAEEKVLRLYDGPAPGSEDWHQEETEFNSPILQTRIIYNVVNPTLTMVEPAADKALGTAVVICPGGGFHFHSIDTEGLDVARYLADKGVTCFVLKYRLVECKTSDPVVEMFQLGADFLERIAPVLELASADGLAAVEFVRNHSAEYGVKTDRIGIIGFSAGGMVASEVAYKYSPDTRPDFVAPIYTGWEKRDGVEVPDDAPPMFILAATDDQLGLAPQSVALYRDWVAAKKSAELHLYAKGGHGFGMRKQNLPSDRWIELFVEWLAGQGFMK